MAIFINTKIMIIYLLYKTIFKKLHLIIVLHTTQNKHNHIHNNTPDEY